MVLQYAASEINTFSHYTELHVFSQISVQYSAVYGIIHSTKFVGYLSHGALPRLCDVSDDVWTISTSMKTIF